MQSESIAANFCLYGLQSAAFARLGGEACMIDIVYPNSMALLGALLAWLMHRERG